MRSVRPNGVKIVIAYLSICIGVSLGHLGLLLLAGYPPGIEYFNLLSSTTIAVEIVGLWRMTRWGFWLAMALSPLGLVAGSYNLALWMDQLYALTSQPYIIMRYPGLFFGIYGGPIQLIGTILATAYLYKRRRIFS